MACEKAKIDKDPELLSEIIYGRWELREVIDALVYRDEEYHSAQEPYPESSCFENDSFLVLAPLWAMGSFNLSCIGPRWI